MFFEQLKKACQMRNTSVTAVVLKLNISKSNVTNWSKGTMPNCDVVIRLSELLDVSTDFLLKGNSEQPIFNNNITHSKNIEINGVKHGATYGNSSSEKEIESETIQELINVFEKLPPRERIRLMNMILDYEEKYQDSRKDTEVLP